MKNIDTLITAFGKIQDHLRKPKEKQEDKKWNEDQQFNLDMFLNATREVAADMFGMPYNYQPPGKDEIQESVEGSERMTPVGPVIPEKAAEKVKELSYNLGADMLNEKLIQDIDARLEEAGILDVYNFHQERIKQGIEVPFNFQDYLKMVTPIRPTEEI